MCIRDSIKPDQLGLSTPCSEYEVRALLGHVLGGLRRAVVIASGGDPLAVSMTTEMPADGWAGAYRRVRAEAEQAWADDAALERMVTVPWGTCLLYTSDAADDLTRVDLGGRRI